MKEYSYNHVGTVKLGDTWELAKYMGKYNVRVLYDSKYYLYSVPTEEKEDFEYWVDVVFWKHTDNHDPELDANYRIYWEE